MKIIAVDMTAFQNQCICY